jgi:murein DD-endopeptidase MepM/ murein hydrolase activator NlpD
MVGQYEVQAPNLVTVVLDANGFQQLLERIGFVERVQRQDAQVVGLVRASRRAVAHEAVRLGALELREQRLARQILAERNSLAQALATLIARRSSAVHSRDLAAGQLAQARSGLAALRGQLAQIQAAQAAAAAAAARRAAAAAAAARAAAAAAQAAKRTQASSATSAPAAAAPAPAPVPASTPAPASSPATSSGGFTFPLPASAVSPPSTWTLDQGVDMAAPGGTPEYAVCSGTIVLHGIGGFGPWAPVLHCDSPLDGYSYVYYGHAGPANQLPVGTHVSAGEVMSEIGPGIVGMSSGPHIEIGFCDASGTPLGTGTSPTMMSLLNASFHG